MIKVRVTKNIIRKNEVAFGLNLSQAIVAAIGVIIGLLEGALLDGHVSTDTKMTIIFFTIAIFIFCGVIQINGMSVITLLGKSLKGVDKRPFDRKGVYNDKKEK
ncbi:MAG: PrgI family protein [Ruminococcus sp.]|nr:PrgI family protein [Ruminococcus sp.]